ncbi:uncharacterized protein LOC134825306 isoform X2 [Bolinopsis microptera]|uniref:uncharacterized protein LOC134825306 isoform X2 n=1 Tax=Bolinopsis microptera TaxID=2820187 RepID=UPI003078BD0B
MLSSSSSLSASITSDLLQRTIRQCAMSSRYNVAYFLAFNIGFLPLPIIIILTSYVVIFITTRKYTRRQLDRISGSSPSWRPLSCESTLEMKRQTSESTQPHKHLTPNFTFPCTNEPIVRLSDEVPLNISSSYDTLRVRQGKWVHTTPNMNTDQETEKSFYKQIVQALRALLIWRPNQGEGEQPGQPHSFVYRTRNTSIALSEEEAAARKLRNQAGTLLIVIGTTILVSYTPLLSIAFLAAFHYNVNVTYSEVQGFILLMLSNASINPLIYFLLNKEFRVAAKSIFFDSAIAIRLRRQSSSFSTRGSVFSQTLTTETSAHHSVTVPVRPASLSASNDFIYRHSHKTPSQESDVTTTPSPVKLKPRIGEYYRPASDPVIKRRMTATQGKARTRPVSGKLAAEERIQKHVLRNSLIVLAPSDREAIKSKSSGLINLSFYEVESAL